jgi:hypothetical protein
MLLQLAAIFPLLQGLKDLAGFGAREVFVARWAQANLACKGSLFQGKEQIKPNES